MEEDQGPPGGLSQPQPQPSSASTPFPAAAPVVAAGGTAMEWQPSTTEPPSHNEPLPVVNEQPAIIPTEPQAYLPPPSSVPAGPPPPPSTTAPPNWSVPGTALPSTLPAPPATAPDPRMPESQNASPVSQHIAPSATPTPLEQPGNLSPNGANAALYRPLNVKDALSYLEMVKIKFHDKPDVYNHFLDIMKDFKSQTIDTPGVIDRVSRLFTGHPSLIQGFNTFLPQGYRIDCSGDGPESSLITVTTPSGTTTQTADGLIRSYAPRHPSGTPAVTPGVASGLMGSFFPSGSGTARNSPAPVAVYTVTSSTVEGPSQPFNNPIPPSKKPIWKGPGPMISNGVGMESSRHSPHPSTPGVASLLVQTPSAAASPQDQSGSASQDSKRPVEFGHAINYVNRIKNRFANDPDTYKQFLEILQTYQKEQRPIRAVYDQVTQLFNNNTDLLEEFKQFLPDPSNGGQEQSGGLMGLMQASGPSERSTRTVPDKAKDRKGVTATLVEKDRDTKSVTSNADKGPQGKRKKRAADKEPPPLIPPLPKSAPNVHAASTHIPSNTVGGPPKAKKSKHHHNRPDVHTPPLYRHGSPDHHPANAAGARGGHPAVQDEQAFFERVKKHIGDRRTYDEFLKLLHLFTEEIIDVRTLVDRASGFLGGNESELFGTFKELVAWDEKVIVDADASGSAPHVKGTVAVVPTADRPRVDLNACRKYGPSYRKLPKHEVNLACSGRDAMCWEVLNDEWVSHPTWASEDAGFSTHKKNQFEDALHKSEEERHEYDFHIEAIIRTITVLEPINTRINMMDVEERAAYKLKPGLGGQGKSIYQRIIKKVYGREHGLEVIQALHDSPSIAIPVVLSRLKQKEEEWKRAQREWNKVWREVDARNFFKSLDHQGINFKVNDKKSINPKQLVLDIETKRREMEVERAKSIDRSYSRTLARYQYQYKVDDVEVLKDALKLVLVYLDRASATSYSVASDARGVEMFLRSFVPMFFMLDEEEFGKALGSFGVPAGGEGGAHDGSEADVVMAGAGDGEDDSAMSVDGAGEDGVLAAAVTVSSGGRNKKKGGDLRKKMFKESKGKKAGSHKKGGGAATPTSRHESPSPRTQSPAPLDGMQVDSGEDGAADKGKAKVSSIGGGENVWIKQGGSVGGDEPQQPAAAAPLRAGKKKPAVVRKKGTFFANNTFYVLLRNLQLLYTRLHAGKQHAAELAAVEQPSSSAVQEGADGQRPLPQAYLANPLAMSLGLADSTGPGASRLVTSGPNPASQFYEHMLECCEQLFEGDMDQATFEDHLRFMFGIRAYPMFTVDKVVASIVKQIQMVLSDVKNKELLASLKKERTSEVPFTVQEQINARRAAEQTIGRDENMYRITWIHEQRLMQIQLLGHDDPSTDDADTMSDRWKQYMASYVLGHETEGLASIVKAPLLKRSLIQLASSENSAPGTPPEEEGKEAGGEVAATAPKRVWTTKRTTVLESRFRYGTRSGMAIKVCVRTYRMFFEAGGEDWFYRKRGRTEESGLVGKAEEGERERKERWRAWLEGRTDVEMN